MAGDVEECPFQMDDAVSCRTLDPPRTAFVNSNMAAEDACIYTATIPTELVGNFPEGSVLQIMPDSTIVAVAVKNTSCENSVVFKNSTFPIESGQTSLNLPNIMDDPNPNSQSQAVDVSVCSEENMDIDLSFLNEAVSTMIPDSKCLSGNGIELQSMIVDASSQSLNLLQSNLPTEKEKCIEEPPPLSESSKDVEDQSNMVMIDVTKPIQLSQNSLIMVNGQTCVLQHDAQTGQVLAYPVKKQEKFQRKRGRPRKMSLEQSPKDAEPNENRNVAEMDYLSEEEREKGLLEVINDDGALVRRSSRKRKTAKNLKDYETGNLKQELGSDVDDAEALDKETESYTHRRKSKGPGRPRKCTKEPASEIDQNSAETKRQRGRPKKMVSGSNEPTQAFLVQTADGQALMMQVPLSSIPPGISLQEMAQEIANKLNLGLNQGNDPPEPEKTSESAPEVSQTAIQDHSIGSTTHFSGIELNGSCEDVMDQTVCETEEEVLESENSMKGVAHSNSDLNTAELHENNFSLGLPSTTSVNTSPVYSNFDHDFCLPSSSSVEIVKNVIEQKDSAQFDKDNFVKDEDMKLVLSDKCDISLESHVQEFLNKTTNSENSSEIPKSFCDTAANHKPISTIKKTTKCISDYVNLGGNGIHVESILKSNVCSNGVENEFSSVSETVKPILQVSPQFAVPDVLNSENQVLGVLLSAEKSSSSFKTSSSDDVTSTSATVTEAALPLQLSEKNINEIKQCKICQMPYLKEEEIIDHFKVKHPKCICLECNYMNEHPYVIKRHAFRHTSHGCVCKICNKKYKDMYILKMHIKMVHLPPEVLYACEICDKKFTRKAHLKRHLRIHAPVKQYQCPHCDYKGCEKSDITKHLLIHDEPKFKCEICGKAFRHVKNKELHLKRHSGQRDYKCAACGFFGYTFTDIRKHIERRHSVPCPQCKQVFTDNELLKDHKRTCQAEQNNEIKVLENSNIAIVNGEATLLDEMPLDILDPSQVLTIGECSEETLSALQNGQLVMTSVGGILNTQSGHLIVEGLEDSNVVTSDNLSVISLEKDPEKMITVVSTKPLPLRNCPLENVMTTDESCISEPFIISTETEVMSEKSPLVLG